MTEFEVTELIHDINHRVSLEFKQKLILLNSVVGYQLQLITQKEQKNEKSV